MTANPVVPSYVRYRLQPLEPVHIGRRGVGLEATDGVFHSDALFNALCYAALDIGGEAGLARFLAPFLGGTPPFLLSSLFPSSGNGAICWYPRPFLAPPGASERLLVVPDDAEGGAAKAFKAIRFVSEGIFTAMQQGLPLAPPDAATTRLGGALWLLPAERDLAPEAKAHYWDVDVRPRVTLDRVTGASQIYHAARLVFGTGAGWWLLVRFNDAAPRAELDRLLAIAGDTGIGGERSSGHGRFSVTGAEPYLPVPTPDAELAVCLSLYHPAAADLDTGVLGPGAGYELLLRHGWVATAQRAGQLSRAVRMLVEGSCLRAAPGSLLGDLSPVTPSSGPADAHPVYRYGYALTLGIAGSPQLPPAILPPSEAPAAREAPASKALPDSGGAVSEANRGRSAAPPPAWRPTVPQRQYPPSRGGKKGKKR